MKKFWSYAKMPIIVGCVALVIYIFDNLIGKLLYPNGSFMWVAFVSWTIFSSVTFKERIQALIGNVIGFGFGVLMYFAPTFFDSAIFGISIAGMLFVFLANGAMMLFPYLKKIWLHSISGIFMGVLLVFSGLGVGLYPSTVSNAFLQLGIILLYSLIGLIAGFVCQVLGREKKDYTKKTQEFSVDVEK